MFALFYLKNIFKVRTALFFVIFLTFFVQNFAYAATDIDKREEQLREELKQIEEEQAELQKTLDEAKSY